MKKGWIGLLAVALGVLLTGLALAAEEKPGTMVPGMDTGQHKGGTPHSVHGMMCPGPSMMKQMCGMMKEMAGLMQQTEAAKENPEMAKKCREMQQRCDEMMKQTDQMMEMCKKMMQKGACLMAKEGHAMKEEEEAEEADEEEEEEETGGPITININICGKAHCRLEGGIKAHKRSCCP